MKKLVYCFALVLFTYTGQALAVFCTALEYECPATGKVAWLCGDIHCDVDLQYTMTRLQQHALLEAAERLNAIIIAENTDWKPYSPYSWVIPFGIDAALFYKAFKDNSYKYFAAAGLSTALHVSLWYADKNKTQKPVMSLTDYIAQLKKNSVVVTLPCLAATPLGSLVQEGEKRGIPAVNLEFRYHMIGAYTRTSFAQLSKTLQAVCGMIYDTQAWIQRKVTGNDIRYPLTLSDYCRINDAIVTEIESYDAEPIMRDFYKKCIESYTTSYMTILLRELPKETGLADILPILVERSGKDAATALRDFTEHNVTLFDARLVHGIVSNQHRNVFVCTGAMHVQNITKVLEQLGYKVKATYGEHNFKILENNGVIGRTFIHLNDLDYLAIDLDKVFVKV